jgi:hypothetical protein
MPKDVFEQAMEMYPALRGLGIEYKISPNPEERRMLEFYPPNEKGSLDKPRPRELPINKIGVEVYNEDVKPLDVLGDVTSHWLIYNDPEYKRYYDNFVQSMTPKQKQRLKGQYEHYVSKEGEERPYEQWEQMTGLPAYFRGYPFKQWPDEFNKVAYTSEQREMLDRMMNQLSGTVSTSTSKFID